ncbi:hypothetical protein EDB83DRAFT_2317473 [Lactarius deliciosus]|nr:hypothetical protein EDB83DRAFT_2317473 [Lactarius deliciosus]
MGGRRGGAGKERERVTPRGQEEEGKGARGREGGGGSGRENEGTWVPRMQYGSRAREAAARAKEAARQRKGGHAVQTADSGMGEKMVTMTSRQCEGEGDRGDDLSHCGPGNVGGAQERGRGCRTGQKVGVTVSRAGRRKQSEGDRGESLSHVTARRGSAGQTGREGCRSVKERGRSTEPGKGAPEKAGQGEEMVENRARIIVPCTDEVGPSTKSGTRLLQEHNSNITDPLTCSTSLDNNHPAWERHLQQPVNNFPSPRDDLYGPDKDVSARIEIVSVWTKETERWSRACIYTPQVTPKDARCTNLRERSAERHLYALTPGTVKGNVVRGVVRAESGAFAFARAKSGFTTKQATKQVKKDDIQIDPLFRKRVYD